MYWAIWRKIHGFAGAARPIPLRLPAVTLLPRARVQRNRVQPLGLRHSRQFDADNLFLVPAHAELYGEGNCDRLAHGAKDLADLGQVAQQSRAAVAANHALGRASQVQVDGVEARLLHNARSIGKRLRIGPEQLRTNRMLVVIS